MKHLTNNAVVLLLLFAISISSCKKEKNAPEPVVDFELTGSGCTAPCSILLTNKSKYAELYNWTFGDGTSSTEQNPTKTYNVGGTYTIVLSATGDGGTSSTSKQVLIQQSTQSQLPSANFTFSGSGCTAPCSITFTNSSTNASSYSWDFGDGTTSAAINPTKTYTNGGAYSVILTAFNAAGNNQVTKIVNVQAPPTKVKITAVTITAMPFTDGSGAGWDVLNGPDVYFEILDQGDNVLASAVNSRINDVTSNMLPLSWNFSTPFEITNFNAPIFVDVWDYDFPDPSDYIGYVGFQMSNYTSGATAYPTSITKNQNAITIKLDVLWQ